MLDDLPELRPTLSGYYKNAQHIENDTDYTQMFTVIDKHEIV